ncbi:ShlB/FhaC/HecB family hemolysin secretion/activation protein [Roseateles oligotrophus]|uniref:ShlB/FhaC/HecB family hemolysin secretion/activation protein n=1 Tax=Roseateles oligotrophus TaxID=1769250 RepID=A0ABT2YFJ7_9BURK|nr:ShlB/FhaC/HecB family hemolysin secretion/activation protein [Roseateles oligotrophus]MCV2368755.1 ShlB/FhaC/HecB family hemolysin secretion/activation protein [Roseateles oligotrophus]
MNHQHNLTTEPQTMTPAEPHVLRLVSIASLTLIASMASLSAHAQTLPDAGQLSQELRRQPEPQRQAPRLTMPTPSTDLVLPGGRLVQLNSVQIGGNTVIDSAALEGLLADAQGKKFDLAGLRSLAERVGEFYQQRGFLFARAYLPPQDVSEGILRIQVLEGEYGQIRANSNNPSWAAQAEQFLSSLQPGSVIASAPLERATLILGDQPGVLAVPLMQPGSKVGSGDLEVEVTRANTLVGSVGLDNHGNRYSGRNRLQVNLDWNSPMRLGDQISLRSLVSDEKLWLGSLAYSTPLGSRGLRATVSYAHTDYQLGKEFASADATGTAKVSNIGLNYPLLRTNNANLKASTSYQHKRLQDSKAGISEGKTSDALVLTFDFDRRDNFGQGGISFGSLSMTPGTLKLAESLAAADHNRTAGRFAKINLDIVRMQNLTTDLSFFGRFSAQMADKNLDSSERITLGGAGGVRSFPNGEATGDQGWLTQMELRYAAGAIRPYAFADIGKVQINKAPTPQTVLNSRKLSGAGLGVRMQLKALELDGALAWRGKGGPPQADTSTEKKPLAWVSVIYRM